MWINWIHDVFIGSALFLLIGSIKRQQGEILTDLNLRPHTWSKLGSLAEAHQILFLFLSTSNYHHVVRKKLRK